MLRAALLLSLLASCALINSAGSPNRTGGGGDDGGLLCDMQNNGCTCSGSASGDRATCKQSEFDPNGICCTGPEGCACTHLQCYRDRTSGECDCGQDVDPMNQDVVTSCAKDGTNTVCCAGLASQSSYCVCKPGPCGTDETPVTSCDVGQVDGCGMAGQPVASCRG